VTEKVCEWQAQLVMVNVMVLVLVLVQFVAPRAHSLTHQCAVASFSEPEACPGSSPEQI